MWLEMNFAFGSSLATVATADHFALVFAAEVEQRVDVGERHVRRETEGHVTLRFGHVATVLVVVDEEDIIAVDWCPRDVGSGRLVVDSPPLFDGSNCALDVKLLAALSDRVQAVLSHKVWRVSLKDESICARLTI